MTEEKISFWFSVTAVITIIFQVLLSLVLVISMVGPKPFSESLSYREFLNYCLVTFVTIVVVWLTCVFPVAYWLKNKKPVTFPGDFEIPVE